MSGSEADENRTCMNASLIVSIHLEDISGRGKKRNWDTIRHLNMGWNTTSFLSVGGLKDAFEGLCLKTNSKNPFPNPAHFYYPVLPPFVRKFSCSSEVVVDAESSQRNQLKMKQLVSVAELVSPEIFFSPPCVTYLGYADEPIQVLGEEDSFMLEERYVNAKAYLSPGKRAAYEAWEKHVSGNIDNHKGRGFVKVGREGYGACPWQVKSAQMGMVISKFKDYREQLRSVDVTVSTKASSLWIVTFKRRRLMDGTGEKVREILSDYELMSIYEQGRLRKFDFEGSNAYQWGKLLRRCDIIDVRGRDAYWDFFKYAAPRLQFLLHRLAPHLEESKCPKLRVNKDLANLVIFQSLHEFSFVKVLKEIYRQESILGIAVVNALVGNYANNVYSAALQFTYNVLVGNMNTFQTSSDDFQQCRLSLANDVCLNWRKFYYDQEGKKFD